VCLFYLCCYSTLIHLFFFPTRRSSDLMFGPGAYFGMAAAIAPSNLMDIHPNVKLFLSEKTMFVCDYAFLWRYTIGEGIYRPNMRSEEHTSELQSRENLVCRLLLEKKKL